MSLRRDHGSDNQLWISYVKTLGQSRNWVPQSSLFRRWDEQSRAEAIFAKKASVPQKGGMLLTFVPVLLSSGFCWEHCLSSVGLVRVLLEAVHSVRSIKADCQWD